MPMYVSTMLDKLRQHGLDSVEYDTDALIERGKAQDLSLEDRLNELIVVVAYLGDTLPLILGELRLRCEDQEVSNIRSSPG